MKASEMGRCLDCDNINWVDCDINSVDEICNGSFICCFCKNPQFFKFRARVFFVSVREYEQKKEVKQTNNESL